MSKKDIVLGRGRIDLEFPRDATRIMEVVCERHKTVGVNALWNPQLGEMQLQCRRCAAVLARIIPQQAPH